MAEITAKALLYCKEGGSDKVYGVALITEEDSSAACVIAYGARGAVGKPASQSGTLVDMLKLYNGKVKEKGKTYKNLETVADDPAATLSVAEAQAAMRHLTSVLGGPGGHPALLTGSSVGNSAPDTAGIAVLTPGGPKVPAVRVSHLLPARKDELPEMLANSRRGITEKFNGRRCVIIGSADGSLRAYTRSGGEVAVPEAANALARLGGAFVVDGEAMERNQAGAYFAFDYLERDGVSLRARPYAERIVLLKEDLLNAGLIGAAGATVARMAATVPGLGLLFPAVEEQDKAAVLDEVIAAGGEGIVIRDLDGPSIPGDTRHELKIKLKGEIDVAVLDYQLRRGMVSGTFLIGVRREADGAWIAIGSANTGLNRKQFEAVKAVVERGEMPVLRIEFLTARTIGISPVEPVVVEVRQDKSAEECLASQLVDALGEDRASLIAASASWGRQARRALKSRGYRKRAVSQHPTIIAPTARTPRFEISTI